MIFDQKTSKMATLLNLPHELKNNCRNRNQRPKIREVRYFNRLQKKIVDPCYLSLPEVLLTHETRYFEDRNHPLNKNNVKYSF